MQQLNLYDMEIYLEGNQVVALGNKAANSVIIFNDLLTDCKVVNSDVYPVVYKGQHFKVTYHPSFDTVPTLVHIDCNLTTTGVVPMVVQPGLFDFVVKYLKNPVSMGIGIHEQKKQAAKTEIRNELVSFVMTQAQRYNSHAQGIILKMLRMLVILGDRDALHRMLQEDGDGNINYLLFGDKVEYEKAVRGTIDLLMGKNSHDGRAVDWWTFPVVDAQSVALPEMLQWCEENGFTMSI